MLLAWTGEPFPDGLWPSQLVRFSMITSLPSSSAPAIGPDHLSGPHRWLSWGAIIAGAVASIAVHLTLTEICFGAGLAVYEPRDPNSSGLAVTAGTVIAMLVSSFIAVFIGGWIAGRLKLHVGNMEAALHGALVWAVGAILAAILLTLTAGAILGGAMSLVGKGVSVAAEGAGAAAGGLTEIAQPLVNKMDLPSWDSIKTEIENGLENRKNMATNSGNGDNQKGAANPYVERSRLMELLGKKFNLDATATLTADEEAEVQRLLASQLGISQEDAKQAMAQWDRVWQESVQAYEQAKEKALEIAETAKERAAQAAFIAGAVMLIGLAAAIAGACLGAKCGWRSDRDRLYGATSGTPHRVTTG